VSSAARRFPWGLTVTSLVAVAILLGLGAWQVKRLAWKEALLAKIAALEHAPARPLAQVLDEPGSAEFVRVAAACGPGVSSSESLYRYAVRDGRIGWRLLGACHVAAGPYDGIVLDRGVIERFMGATSPQPAPFPPPNDIVGVLRTGGSTPLLGPALMEQAPGFAAYRVLDGPSLAKVAAAQGVHHPAPYVLAVESETPPVAGVTPAALPQDIPNNHLVYALTWFALALILVWFYGAMVVRRMRA
jgi:surfeit locus 1 family protein